MELKIELSHAEHKPIILPHAYQHTVEGLIFKLLSAEPEYAAELHNCTGGRRFRGFTFGPLQGGYTSESRSVVYSGRIALTVRAHDAQFIGNLVKGILTADELRLASNSLQIDAYSVTNDTIAGTDIKIRMLSPITVYKTDENHKTRYFNPEDACFYGAIAANARRKYAYLTGEDYAEELTVERLFADLPKRMFTVYKGSYITAWYGDYKLTASNRMLNLLYNTGIGAKNSQGFGMFEIRGQGGV